MNRPVRVLALLSATILLASGCSQQPDERTATPPTDTAEITVALASPGLVLLDFNATWCGPCKQMKPIVEKAARDYAGKIKIIPIDIDAHKEIAERYHVESIPDFIILKDGKSIDSRLGAMPEKQFLNWIEGFIAASE